MWTSSGTRRGDQPCGLCHRMVFLRPAHHRVVPSSRVGRMTGTYGVTITGNVATITLSVPALWWLAVTVMAGVFLTWTTVRDWIGGVLTRVWKDDATTSSGGTKTWE